MAIYPNLPGVQVQTLDGGLSSAQTFKDKSVLIIGSSGIGPAGQPYQVTDNAIAAQLFGFSGSLIKVLQEVQTYSDNITLFRMGTAAATLAGIGAVSSGTVSTGLTISFDTQRTATVATDYKIWYGTGLLYIWNSTGTLVYSNDSGNRLINTGEVVVTGAALTGLAAGAQSGPTMKTIAGAVTVAAAAALPAAGANTAYVFTAAVTGLGLAPHRLYEAQQDAFNLLGNFISSYILVPDCVADNPNIAFYAPANPNSPTAAESVNNPLVNPNAIGWLKTWIDSTGLTRYHWSHYANDSTGATVVGAPFTFTVATNPGGTGRLDQGYYEVNFPYQLARYCAQQSVEIGGCMGVIGFTAPTQYGLAGIRTWLGKEPTLDPITGAVTASGNGLLGFVYTRGLAQASLNVACADAATFRAPGLFDTIQGEYDGTQDLDKNQNQIDLGAYLMYAGDWAYTRNGFGQYPASIAGTVTGILSGLDDKVSTTNQQTIGLTQLSFYSLAYLDALTRSKIIMLRTNLNNSAQPPVLLHGWTGAINSDYNQLIRQRAKFRVADLTRQEAYPFIGKASTDGLQLISLQANLRSRFATEVKNGYFASIPTFVVTATVADQKLGNANINVSFVPPAETVRLVVTVGVTRR